MAAISKRKVRTFLTKLNTAQKAIHEKEKSKTELDAQFEKVRKVSLERAKKSTVENELKKLNQKVNELLEKEKSLLLVQTSNIKKSDLVRDKINEVYSIVRTVKDSDEKQIPEIALSVRRLESKLDRAVKHDQALSLELKNKVGEIETKLIDLNKKRLQIPKYHKFIDAVDEIKEQVNMVVKEKTKSQSRINELEEKIQRGEIETRSEFDLVESKIARLQKKLFELKSKGHNSEHLNLLQNRINKLKEKVDQPVDFQEEIKEFSEEDLGIPEPFA